MLITFLLLALSFDVRHSIADPRVLEIMRQMAIIGAQQFDQTELAAFLVRDANGVITSFPWPRSGRFRSERYEGVIPAGTVALVHTHPWQAGERPSLDDIDQARKIGLPIYVVTRWNLYVVDSSGHVIALFARTNWTYSTRPEGMLNASK